MLSPRRIRCVVTLDGLRYERTIDFTEELAQRGKAGLDMAFFTLNGIASVTLGLAGLVDLFL